jgi:hypothetical protein
VVDHFRKENGSYVPVLAGSRMTSRMTSAVKVPAIPELKVEASNHVCFIRTHIFPGRSPAVSEWIEVDLDGIRYY